MGFEEWASYPTRAQALNCGSPFRAVRGCGCGVSVVRDHCDVKECEHNYCGDVLRKKRARLIEDKFEAGLHGRSVIYTVFTVPPSRRLAAAETVTLRPRRKKDGSLEPRQVPRWKLWLDELVDGLKGALCLEYACERSDPAGEDRDRWHPHINLLWVREDGDGFITEEQLEALKSEWKRIVGVREEDPISIYTSYAKPKDEARRRHWYSYMGRIWPGWEEQFPYLCRIKWLGKPAKRPEREPDPCCPKCEQEVIVIATGSPEAAELLAARGYEALQQEWRAVVAFRRRRLPVEFKPLAEIVIDCRRT